MTPNAFGPSQPSAPVIQIIDTKSPASVSNRSEIVRMKTRISAAISRKASPSRGAIPSSVALLYSSSITTGETLLTRRGPSSRAANSWILRSASSIRSSPVSSRRMVAIAIGVPSESLPVNASSAARISGGPRIESISAWDTDSKPSTWSRASTSSEGAMTGSEGASNTPTLGSPTMSSTRSSIWESPPGVSASPRKRSVMTFASESPKNSSISARTLAMSLPSGRVAAVSGGGASRVVPAPSAAVMTRRARSVRYGRTVTSRRNQPSILLMSWTRSLHLLPPDSPKARSDGKDKRAGHAYAASRSGP